MPEPLLEVRSLKKYFAVGGSLLGRRRGWVKAVDGVSFTINQGQTLGLVGESGCGKTTTSKLILAAEEPTAGTIAFAGRNLAQLDSKGLMDYRRQVQVPGSLQFSESAHARRGHYRRAHRDPRARVAALLEMVGLRFDMARLFPHEFSGGSASAWPLPEPCRPTPAWSCSMSLSRPWTSPFWAHVIGLLETLQARLGVSYLFIAHDLAAVAHLSHQIAVMYLGKLVEVADSLALCAKPLHPYTKALFAASLPSHPDEAKEEVVLTGEVPSALNPPSGCHFHPRCPFAMPQCGD